MTLTGVYNIDMIFELSNNVKMKANKGLTGIYVIFFTDKCLPNFINCRILIASRSASFSSRLLRKIVKCFPVVLQALEIICY